VSGVLVDDDRDFSSPEDAVAWPGAPKRTRWASMLLGRDRYHVRLRVKHSRCDSCVWTSPTKVVEVTRTNNPPTLRPARFEVVRQDAEGLRHTWKATFTVCDRTHGELRLQILEQTGPIGDVVADDLKTLRRLGEPDGCRAYTVTRRSAFPFRDGTYVRVTIRVRDGLGVWSVKARKVTWETTA
jgi:hypothetical protein